MIIWDFPLRLFHWGLAIAVMGAIISAKTEVLWLHERFGLAVMGLVGFRLCWGVVGGHFARFRQFLVWPSAALAGARQLFQLDNTAKPGHSPLGSYAVMGLLAVTGFMSISGSMSNDDVLFEGPLAHLVPDMTNTASEIHHLGEKALFLMLFLHIAAILIYKFIKRRNLTIVMLKGTDKSTPDIPSGTATPNAVTGSISKARTIFGVALLLCWIIGAQSLSLLRPSLF